MRDIDIRLALHADALRWHQHELASTRIVDELALCQGVARVDVAVVNGVIHGYEIKSEHDTLARLAGQVDVYSRALDSVTIVTGATHAERVAQLVPHWWGIMRATDGAAGVRLELIRPACDNPQLELLAQVQLLWRDEALEELEARNLADGVRSKPRRQLWQRLARAVEPDELRGLVRERLKRRVGWRASEDSLAGRPSSVSG